MVSQDINPTAFAKQAAATIQANGELHRIKYYVNTFSGADWDEEYLTTSGTAVWAYGVNQPVSAKTAGEDLKLFEQGKILLDDRKLYIAGSVSMSGATVKIGIGSPVRDEYFILNNGRIPFHYGEGGSVIYTKCYLRNITAGSFWGEY